ncbi:MAG: IPT/TIG domain-containing protein [Candidatus Acidiferrales bacterium]
MGRYGWVLGLGLLAILICCSRANAQGPTITGLSPTSGPVGTLVTITGTGFGATQGSSAISLNGTSAAVMSWSDTSILALVPTGASSGSFSVTVNSQGANSSSFTVTPLPSGWSDGDIGSVGVAGSATYANGVFTVEGSGTGIYGTADEMNFAYQSLSSDGSIIARVVTSSGGQATVMIRETLNTGARDAYADYQSSDIYFDDRTSTGGSESNIAYLYHSLPYWVQVVRSSGTFSVYTSLDGVNWTQLGSTQTISMAQDVYVGLAVSSENNSTLATATFDNVSVNPTASPAPSITSLSATTGSIGSQVTISGSGFGASQGSSLVTLNDAPVTVNSWSATSISVTIPSGATSGPMVVSVASSMNDSNPVVFTATSQPLPTGWLDQDIGSVGLAGSATYASGVFTVKGAGGGIYGYSDGIHFVYQPLSSSGSIVARVVSTSGGQAGVMIRQALSANSADASDYYDSSYIYFDDRSSAGGWDSNYGYTYHALPYWVQVVWSGSTFTAYTSPDGVNWTQLGNTQTVTMTQNVYIGLAVSSYSTSTLATATFDNVSVSSSASPAPTMTSLSATTGPVGTQVVISGSGFGSSQGSSLVTLSDTPATIDSWSATSISVTIPSGAASGPMVVSVAPSMNDSNPLVFTVTAQPLPASWLDQDVGTFGVAGSATYANGVFTVQGGGTGITGTSDGMHFAYQPMSGNGTIVARIVSTQGSGVQAGVMIRAALDANAEEASVIYSPSDLYFYYRSSTGGSTGYQGNQGISGLPYWVELVRSGNTFTAYTSVNGLSWTQLESSETISMPQTVYIGLAVSSQSTSSLATATFDNVSISPTANPAPVITSLYGTTGPVGANVVISGSGFGASQSGSEALLNGSPMTIVSWTATSIIATVPSGGTSGPVVVSVTPSMNDSNPMMFNVTSQPLPVPWLDQDVGVNGAVGNATFANDTFTVQGSGSGVTGTADSMHFVYQALSGDGSIVARVVSVTGGSGTSTEAGVMIRETLNPNATNVFLYNTYGDEYFNFTDRATTGGGINYDVNSSTGSPPYWIELVRSGNTFTAYISPDGMYWTQLGSTQTITMAQNVYIGLAVSSENSSDLKTATFDNVSVNSTANPAPQITSLSATTGPVGSQIEISGSGFGSTANGSLVTLNDSPVTIDSWGATSIIITIPTGATSGPMVVSVAPSMNDSNPVGFTVTSQPLPLPWVDQDIGPVGLAGSATYASGVFTLQGSGLGIQGTADGMHFVYQPMSGNGSIVARVASVQGSIVQAVVMIRGSLDDGSVDVYPLVTASNSYVYLYDRSTAGGSAVDQGNTTAVTLPYWLQIVVNGSTFSAYMSPDGVNWTQVLSNQTITMPSPVYVGFGVSSEQNTSLSTATFDNVSVIIGTTPVVTGILPDLAGIGTSVTITGSNFGSTQGTSAVSFNGVTATSITSWSNNQIVAVVPAGAATGPVAVTVNSIQSIANPTLTILNPVITSVAPPAAEVSGEVTITGSGFGNYIGAGQVEINGVSELANSWSNTSIQFDVGSTTTSGPLTVVVQGISSNSVSFTVLTPLSITGISQISGSPGDTVTITGTGFGSTQSDSVVTFDGVTATATSWSNTSIQAVVPSGASTGPVTVEVANVTADGPVFTISGATVVTDSLGNQTTYAAGIVGGNWYVTSGQGSGCSSCTIRGNYTYQYDNLGNILSTTDPLGNVTSNTYDSYDNPTSLTQPSVTGGTPVTTYTYNSFGEVLTMTDPLGHVTTNTYDTHGNLLSVTTPAPNSNTTGSVTQFAYNSLGQLTQITDPLGRITSVTYTPAGLIASITDPQSNVTTYAYDSRGDRTSVTDAMGNQTAFTYDMGDRLTGITYPDQSTASFTYDYRGRRITATDQDGNTTSYAYDAADRLTSVTDPAGNVTQYTHDTENNLLSITDANGHTTNFTYDAFGRVTQATFPSNYSETYAYDADNNLTSKTDRNGNTIQYVYDALNRLTQKTYPDLTTAEYTYDLVSKILQVNDPTGTYAFAYDNMGRRIGTTTTYSFLPNTPFTNSYTHDAESNRTGFTSPDGSTNTYTFDTLNRLTTLANSWAGSFGFSYDALSRRTQMTRPNGIATNYQYNTLSRLLSVLHQAGSSTIDGEGYTLDAAGNRTAKTDDLVGVTSNYTYDKIYELTQVTQGNNTTESYGFDPVGNRTESLAIPSYTVNSSPELTSDSSASYTYDNNGNTISKTNSSGTTNYAWDFENRLTQVTLPNSGGTVTFKYDPFGRRIYKQSPTATSIFVYDGDNLVETMNGSGGEVASYAQGQNIDEPLAMDRSGTIDYYEQDGLGSVTSLSASNGSLAQSYTYDSFGNTTNSSGSLTNFFRYTGREFDTETNLYYYRARYYDPTNGRFISEDLARFMGGMDFYRYVANDPIRFSDPLGFAPNSCQPDICNVYQQLNRPDLYFICEHLPHSPKANCVRKCLVNFFGPGPGGKGRYIEPPVFWGVGMDALNPLQNAYGPVTHISCFIVCGWPF